MRLAGCTVHYVRSEVDSGPIVVQAAVPVLTRRHGGESWLTRVLREEHRCLPLAVRLIAQGRVSVVGERCVIDAEPVPAVPSLTRHRSP